LFVPIAIVPTVMGLRYAQRERELEHAERMKAFELGRRLPQDEPWWSPARIAVAIGAVVPVGVFGLAVIAGPSREGFSPELPAALVISVTAIVSATWLAHRHAPLRVESPGYAEAKPTIDEDAYDVVGRRG
jgi:hypothetical protein